MSIKKVQSPVVPRSTSTASAKVVPIKNEAKTSTPSSDFSPTPARASVHTDGVPLAGSGNVGWSDTPASTANSALKFDAHNADVQSFAASQGWNLPGQKVGIVHADLVYTTDNWKTTHTAPIQYLYNNSQGFLLRDVPKGTQIQFAIHAQVGVSHDGFYSYDDKKDVWFNNNGWNYQANTGDVTGA